jgi:antitoxin (DNA-binding transcriptional repressor) of toxin-antitoxin stability system
MMTVQMNIAEAKAKLAELVRRAEAGEEVVIARDGKPVVVMKATGAQQRPDRIPGLWAHLGPLSQADLEALDEPLYTEEELNEMIEDWGVPRASGK